MEITLHIGAHRTGATSLQAVLAQNRAGLAARDVALWGAEEAESGLYSGLIKPIDPLTPQITSRGVRSLDVIGTLLDLLEDEGTSRLVISAPDVIGTVPHQLSEAALYPFAAERLGRFVPAFHRRCDRIVLTIRSYDTYWTSAIAANVARGKPYPGRRIRGRLAGQTRRWRRLVEEIATTLPGAHLIVMPYESMAGQWLALWAALGIPSGAPLALPGRDRLARGPGPWKLRKILAERGAGEPPLRMTAEGRWQPFSDEEAQALRQAYAEDLDWLRAGASGLATFIESADAKELRKMDRTRGPTADDAECAEEDEGRLGQAG